MANGQSFPARLCCLTHFLLLPFLSSRLTSQVRWTRDKDYTLMGFLRLHHLRTPWGRARHTHGLDGAIFRVQPASDTAESILVGHLDTAVEGVALSLVLIPVHNTEGSHTKGSTLKSSYTYETDMPIT